MIIPFSGIFETKIFDMEDAAKEAYFKEQGATRLFSLIICQANLLISLIDHSALEKIIVSGFKALQLIYFFTAGADEVKAWTVQVRTHKWQQLFYNFKS